jgi:cell division protein FtsN
LQAQLAREGIPSRIETRVQVGPFESPKEANVVRKKLNTLGIDSVLLAPKKAAR